MKLRILICLVVLGSQAASAQTTIDLENQVRGVLPVPRGGTGGTDAGTARTNLGLTSDYLDEDHTWLGSQDIINFNKIRYAHLFAASGAGTAADPWIFTAGHPWADPMADGGQTIIFSPGTYQVDSCTAIVPTNTTLWSFNREQVDLRINCHGVLGRLDIVDAANTTPIQIETAAAHGFTTGDSVNIGGVPGNNAANGDWQVTVVDSTHFTLDGSSGNGDFVNTATGYWAGRISAVTNYSGTSPVEITTATAHGLVTGDRVLVEGFSGFDSGRIGGQRDVTVTGPNTVTLDLTAPPGFTLSGGTLRGISAVDAIATATDGRGIMIRGLTIDPAFTGRTFLRNVIGFRASESVLEEIAIGLTGGDFDQIVGGVFRAQSAAVAFTGDGSLGQTVVLELTGGGSRASGSYPAYTVAPQALPSISQIDSPLGGTIVVHFSSPHNLDRDGEIVTISSTAETDAAGASGTWNVGGVSLDRVLLTGSSGTGADCSSGCGGATATETALRPGDLAKKFAAHLNGEAEFSKDYQAVARGPVVHLVERKFSGSPTVFEVTSPIAHSKTGWVETQKGGNSGLFLNHGGFSSHFSRIICPGAHRGFHCVTMQGINNQHSFRDIRLSGGNNAGWGMRFAPTSGIQDINIDTMTVESSYGGLEIASLTGSSISGLYMELGDAFGVRINDTAGASFGASFVHANTISNGFLLGDSGLILEKGRDLTVENSVISGECRIGTRCENCTIRSSFAFEECVNESLSGYLENHSTVRKPPRPIDRYGEILATPRTGLLDKAVTNHVRESEDLTVPPWFDNGNTSLVSATNPFGDTQLISRSSVASPAGATIYILGKQALSGLVPDSMHTVSHWLRVVTPGATCSVQGAALVNRELLIEKQDGWVRVAGNFRSSATGTHTVTIGCFLAQTGLPDFTVDSFGVMVSDLQNSGALPPYIPTEDSAVTAPAGLYAKNVELSGDLANLPRCRTFSVSHNDLAAAAPTEDVVLFQLPARGVMTGVTLKHDTAFAGGTLTGMAVTVGDSSGPAAYSDADGLDVFQPVSDTVFEDYTFFKSTTFAARDVVAGFTATGDNTGAATSGDVRVTACFALRP